MMSTGYFAREAVTRDTLYEVLDAALMEVEVDGDGDVLVREGIVCYVLLPEPEHDRITLAAQYSFMDDVPHLARLECANRINQEYVLVRAAIDERGKLRFSYHLLLAGGITARQIALSVKRFCAICPQAVAEHAAGLLE
ncbi:YbjN domain-containing protein [Niveibacterium sp.]|uniref:YbjN domain-containing protein n=1 Tax=Niveibacterium sp. TaxID=2017444 RepID=UPI0035B3CD1D